MWNKVRISHLRGAFGASGGGGGLTYCDDIAECTQLPKVPRAFSEVSAAAEEGNDDGHDVRNGQKDDSRAAEGIEGRSRPKVDETQQDLYGHAEHHGVERHVEFGVDSFPESRPRHGSVAGEGPDATRRGGGAGGAAEDGEDDDWNRERKGAALIADGRAKNERQRLGVGVVDDIEKVRQHEHQRQEKDDAAKPVQSQCPTHGFGNLPARVADLLGHAK